MTYWSWSTKEVRKGHALSHLCGFDEDEEVDCVPTISHIPLHDRLGLLERWTTLEEMVSLLLPRRVGLTNIDLSRN